jgi:DNA-binding CsgD family transcriptional regulator
MPFHRALQRNGLKPAALNRRARGKVGPPKARGVVMSHSIALSTHDLGHLLELTEAIEHQPDGERFAGQLLSCLCRIIGCDDVTYSDLDAKARFDHAYLSMNEDDGGCDSSDETGSPFWQHYWSCPPSSYRDATGDVAVTMVADFYSARQWRSQPTYVDRLQPNGLTEEMMVSLPGEPGQAPRVLFWRQSRPFTDRDRLLARLLLPHIVAAHRAFTGDEPAIEAPPVEAPPIEAPLLRCGLTKRQFELMRLVAAGLSNRQIGRQLGISQATVGKHLENVYHRLAVPNRAAAVAVTFPSM